MATAMKEPTKRVIKYLQKHNGEDLTAADVAEALGFEKRQVDGIFTSAVQRKEYGYREEAERMNSEGKHDKVKYLRLTEKGINLDVDNPTAE